MGPEQLLGVRGLASSAGAPREWSRLIWGSCGTWGGGLWVFGLSQELSEIGKQRIFFLPGSVHESTHFADLAGDLKPVLDVLEIVCIIVARDERAKALFRKKAHAGLARLSAPDSHDQMFGDICPRTREIPIHKVVIAVSVVIGIQHVGPDINLETGNMAAQNRSLSSDALAK